MLILQIMREFMIMKSMDEEECANLELKMLQLIMGDKDNAKSAANLQVQHFYAHDRVTDNTVSLRLKVASSGYYDT